MESLAVASHPLQDVNRAEGISEIEGKVARVATRELGSERISIAKAV